jgi:hypothetical protein
MSNCLGRGQVPRKKLKHCTECDADDVAPMKNAIAARM